MKKQKIKNIILLIMIGIAAAVSAVTVFAWRHPGALMPSNETEEEDVLPAQNIILEDESTSLDDLRETEPETGYTSNGTGDPSRIDNEYDQAYQEQLEREKEEPEQDDPASNGSDSPVEDLKSNEAEENANEATKAQNEPQNASEGTNPANPDVLSDTSTNYGEDTTGDTEEHPAPSGFTQEELDWMNSIGVTTGGDSTGVTEEVYIDPNAGQDIEMNGTWY